MIESGTSLFRSKFKIRERKLFDAKFYFGYPVLAKFVLPGDVWKINVESFIRFQPMLSPTLTPNEARIRFFYVPIRLVESNTELIITGSKDGYWNKDVEIPSFEGWKLPVTDGVVKVGKGNLFELMTGVPPANDYDPDIKTLESWPADYWRKGYWRVYWDYYRDENISETSAGGDFDTFLTGREDDSGPMAVKLPHDYFTSSLPWQLKGIAPAMDFGQIYFDSTKILGVTSDSPIVGFGTSDKTGTPSFGLSATSNLTDAQLSNLRVNLESFATNFGLSSASFNMSDLRDLSAQTRVFERLARCGSRYTEYLRANFGTAPADDTLQRSVYIGGLRLPIVTTEIPQTAGATNASDERTPVGTLRGKGISAGGGSVSSYHAKEFGMIFGIMDMRPALQYTQGLPREFTYKRRFDFFNPSFQHLSEQEVRNSEIYFDDDKTGGTFNNDKTFGFQIMYNELRTGKTMIVGDMRDTLSFWHQGINFGSRPSLNGSFINGPSYSTSWNRPFEVISGSNPIICDVACHCEVHRPMVRYGTPGLVDHL